MSSTAKARSDKDIFDRRLYAAEHTVFEQGDHGNVAWYIESGKVLIVRDGPAGRIPLGALGAGEIFGEMALIDNSPRMASAVTLEPTVLVPIASRFVEERIEKADPFIGRLLQILVQNVRSITDRHVDGCEFETAVADTEADRVVLSLKGKLSTPM